GEVYVLPRRVSPALSPTRTRPSDRRNRPPAVSADLEDPPRRHSVRGTRASRQRRSEEGAGAQDDPRTPKSWLSGRARLTRCDGVRGLSTLAHSHGMTSFRRLISA